MSLFKLWLRCSVVVGLLSVAAVIPVPVPAVQEILGPIRFFVWWLPLALSAMTPSTVLPDFHWVVLYAGALVVFAGLMAALILKGVRVGPTVDSSSSGRRARDRVLASHREVQAGEPGLQPSARQWRARPVRPIGGAPALMTRPSSARRA